MEHAEVSEGAIIARDSPATPLLLSHDGPPSAHSAARTAPSKIKDDEKRPGSEGMANAGTRVAAVVNGGRAGAPSSHEDIVPAETVWQEVRCQLVLAYQLVGFNIVWALTLQVPFLFLGRLGQGGLPLAGGSLAISFSNVLGNSLVMGLATGLETLMGQAFGARQYDNMTVVLHQALIFNLALCVPLGWLWIEIKPVLIAMGQDPVIADYTATYLRLLLPGLVGNALLLPLQKFLQVQDMVLPTAICGLIALTFQIPATYFMVFKFDFGFKGAAIATSGAYVLNLILTIAFFLAFNSKLQAKISRGLSRKCLYGWGAFLNACVPALAMMMLEWIYFEGLILFSGILPNAALNVAALGIQMNFFILVAMGTAGLSTAASIRVGRWLGAGFAQLSKRAAQVALSLAAGWGIVLAPSMYLLRESIANIYVPVTGGYGDSPNMLAATQKLHNLVVLMIELLSLQQLQDSFQFTSQGVIRGLNRQMVGTWICLGTYYILGAPVAYLLGVRNQMGAPGLWISTIPAETFLMIAYSVLLYFTDWVKEVSRARILMGDANNPIEVYIPPPLTRGSEDTHPSHWAPGFEPLLQPEGGGVPEVETRKPPPRQDGP